MSGKTAFLFPGQGQGSVNVGMGRHIWENSRNAREVFYAADYHLGYSLSGLCFFGPEKELFKTANSQLAVLTTSLAYVAARSQLELEFLPNGVAPDFLAGHSVGYIAALVFAGSITFHQALDFISKVRGPEMSRACQINPGSMLALINPDRIEIDLLRQKLNLGGADNSETQIILSGPVGAIELAEKEIRENNWARKIIPLSVEGGFHSVCMAPAEEPIGKYVKGLDLRPPNIPIIGNSRVQVIASAVEAKREFVSHLCQPVLWHQSINRLREEFEVATFVEMGHGEALSGNLKRGLKTGAAVAVVSFSTAMGVYFLQRHHKGRARD